MAVKCDYTQYAINGFSVVSAEMNDVSKLIQEMQSSDLMHIGTLPVYKISMRVNETYNTANFKHTSNSECEFYIADHVQTDTQINDAIRKKYKDIKSIPTTVGKPAILEDVSDETLMMGGLRGKESTSFGPRAVSVGKNIDWHVLDPEKDIVVDKKLHQIYPQKTGTLPVMIQKLLQKTK